MKNSSKPLTIPTCLLDSPSLDCTERVLLAYIADHPTSSDRQLSEATNLSSVNVRERIHDLCHREHLHQATTGGARKFTVVALELDRAKTELTRPDLTSEAAGDTLLALFDIGQVRLGTTEFEGSILKPLGLSSLGCALLLEAAMLHRFQHRRANASGDVPSPPAGAAEILPPAFGAPAHPDSSPAGGESTRGGNWTWHQTDGHSVVAQLAAVLEAQARDQCGQALSPPDTRSLEVARGWLELGEWSEALGELDKIEMRYRLHPDVLSVAIQAFGAAHEFDHAWLLGLISILLAPDRVENWLAAATAARLAPSAGVNCELITLFKTANRHPKDWRVSYRLACCFCHQGDLAGTREFLYAAENQGGGCRIEAMLWDEPDLAAYRHDILKDEPK